MSEAEFVAVQQRRAPRRGKDGATRNYLLAGLVQCRLCGRRMDAHWVNGRAGYRCRHGYHSARTRPACAPRNLYVREDEFGVPRATAYRYRDEALTVLAAQAPDLHEALQEVAEQGWSHVVVDGKLIRTDRCAETTTSVKGETINAWYSGKHRAPGGNVQAVIRPDGVPIWVSDVAPGHLHDLTVARDAGVIGALNWAASRLDLPTLADSGYDGAGQGITTPIKQPAGGQVLAPDNQAYNTLQRATRCRGERGFALLTGRWRALQRVTISPRRISELAQAALVLTRIENVQLRHSC